MTMTIMEKVDHEAEKILNDGVYSSSFFNFSYACVNQFKSLPIFDLSADEIRDYLIEAKAEKSRYQEFTAINRKLMASGIYLTEEAFYLNPIFKSKDFDVDNVIEHFVKQYGYDFNQVNASFHTLAEAANKPVQELLIDQILHYFSTYGLEALDIHSSKAYFPVKELKDASFLDESLQESTISVTVISAVTMSDVKERVDKMLSSGIAMKQKTINDLFDCIKYLNKYEDYEYTEDDVNKVKNKEFKILLYEYFSIIPSNPNEFMRYVIYLFTNKTMVIKSSEVIHLIRCHMMQKELFNAIKNANSKVLAEVFFRYKPLFLAMKQSAKYTDQVTGLNYYKDIAAKINHIRRLAEKYHKPMKTKILDRLTALTEDDINNEEKILQEITDELKKVTIYKKISLTNALLYRRSHPEHIAFFIRNGKAFAKPTAKFDSKKKSDVKVDNYEYSHLPIYDKILSILIGDIVSVLKENVGGKTVYIPDNVVYALPTSEKMFVGHIPNGTSLKLGKDIIVAIHWFNKLLKKENDYKGTKSANEMMRGWSSEYVETVEVNGKEEHYRTSRVDLDLHINSRKYEIGWNNQFNSRNEELRNAKSLLFTGDMTTAPYPLGAAEACAIGESIHTDELLMVDMNNFTNNGPIEYDFIIDTVDGNKKSNVFADRKYVIDNKDKLFKIHSSIEGAALTLGYIDVSSEDNTKTFYFSNSSLSSSICSHYNAASEYMTSAIRTKMESCLKLNDLLKIAGAKFEQEVDEEGNVKPWDISLDMNQVTKDMFIDLLTKKEDESTVSEETSI